MRWSHYICVPFNVFWLIITKTVWPGNDILLLIYWFWLGPVPVTNWGGRWGFIYWTTSGYIGLSCCFCGKGSEAPWWPLVSWVLGSVPGTWEAVCVQCWLYDLSFPWSQRKEGSDKLVLMRSVVVMGATATACCLPAVGPAGLSLSDTGTIRQACPEAWGIPSVFQLISCLILLSFSRKLFMCWERSWRSFFLPCSLFLNAWVHSSHCLKTLLGNHKHL